MGYKPLGECVERIIDHRGLTPKKLGGSWSESGYRALSAKNIKDGLLVQEDAMNLVSEEMYRQWMPEEVKRGDVFITSEAPFGEVLYWDSDEKLVLSQRVFGLTAKTGVCNSRYLYYWMRSPQFQGELRGRATGTTVIGLRQPELLKCQVHLLPLEQQTAIACLLGAIDGKIALNNKINGYLLELAMVRFESALEAESKTVRFGDIVALEDSKRVPLNSRDREARKGPYPYYGATSVMDHVNDYLFDEIRVLLGEDGTVIDSEGRPILQYVWGKYWVNNHAHILAPSGEYSLEAIYIALRRTAINHIVTGAAQMKISQRNLKSLELEMPSPKSLGYLQDLFAAYRINQDESAKLAGLRDALLPKLMSGEIDVSRIDLSPLNSHLSDC